MQKQFWKNKSLFEMSHQEWESICDGCGKCCLQQLQDEDTGELVFTDVACDLFEQHSCRCTDYQNRSQKVPNCMTMNKDNVFECAEFAPPSCSYRLLLQGDDLPEWHHLVSGDTDMIHQTGNSVSGKVRLQREIDQNDFENYIVEWPLKHK